MNTNANVTFKQKHLPPNFEDILNRIFFNKSNNYFFTDENEGPRTKEEEAIYRQHVCVDKQSAVNICRASQDQSSSLDWFSFRKFRITASKAHLILHGKKLETRQNYFLDTTKSSKTTIAIPACEYGIQLEEEARKKFIQLTNYRVYQFGLVVRDDQPWLAGSPDGVFVNEKNELCVLEIKCPFTCKDGPINTRYIVNNDLLMSHSYYTQVQLLMYIIGANNTSFFVYSSQDFKHIIVPINKPFINSCIIQLEKLYFNECLPFLNTVLFEKK